VKDVSKTIADAQAFIDSVKQFNKNDSQEEEDELGSSLRDPGSNPFGGSYSSLSSSLSHKTSLELKRPPPPVGRSNSEQFGFPKLNFSRKADYEQPFRVDVLTFVEVYYYENKRLPDHHVLHEHFREHPDRPNFLKGWTTILESISDSLANRGIKPYNTVENYIDPKFAWATSLIVNHLDKRTIPAKLKEAGLTTKEWQAFLRRKRHYDYFQARLDEVFDQDVKNDAKLALARAIENGDLQAIKYYNELKNIYRPETQSAMQMVSIVLTAVMEILAIHVPPDTLNRVAAEIRTSPSVRKVIEAQAR
jgi:hypothetical protein